MEFESKSSLFCCPYQARITKQGFELACLTFSNSKIASSYLDNIVAADIFEATGHVQIPALRRTVVVFTKKKIFTQKKLLPSPQGWVRVMHGHLHEYMYEVDSHMDMPTLEPTSVGVVGAGQATYIDDGIGCLIKPVKYVLYVSKKKPVLVLSLYSRHLV